VREKRSPRMFDNTRMCVCVCVCDHIQKVCEHSILQTARENFTKFIELGAVGDRGELITF